MALTVAALAFPLPPVHSQTPAPFQTPIHIPRYSLVNLTAIGGPHPYGRVSVASLNKSGQIAGYFNDINAKTSLLTSQAFVWKDGKTTLLPPPQGFAYSTAEAQNDAGLVVGQAHNDLTEVKVGGKMVQKGGDSCACVWESGVPRRLTTGRPGDSGATAINGQGDVVGDYIVHVGSRYTEHACLWKRGGGFLDLGPTPPSSGKKPSLGWGAVSINDQDQVLGQMAGGGEGQAGPTLVFWEKGRARLATAQDRRLFRQVRNGRGQVLRGDELLSQGVVIPLRWLGRSAQGLDLNDAGQVVGAMPAVKLKLPPQAQRSAYDYHAFLWQGGQMLDLNGLIPPSAGLVLETAMNIDDQGRILVWASRRMADGPLLLVPAGK